MVVSIFRGFCKHKDKSLSAQWTLGLGYKWRMPSFTVIGWVLRVYPRRQGKNMAVRTGLIPAARKVQVRGSSCSDNGEGFLKKIDEADT